MSKRIAHHTVAWSVAILGTLWIAAGMIVDLWSDLQPRRRARLRVDPAG